MNFSRYIAFSIVASSVLCGANNYSDWNTTAFNDGDSVNITYKHNPAQVNQKLPILTKSITLASGTLNVNVNAIASKETCGIIACLSGSTTFGSAGSTINFNVNGGTIISNPAAFDIKNGGSLTADANIKVIASGNIPAGIFRAKNGANLTFNGNVELSGASTAITMGNGILTINQNGGKKVDISGAISSNGGTTNIKLDSNDDKINGTITANGGSTTLDLSGGSQITGAFNGSGNSNLTLTIDSSTYKDNVTNAGTSNVTIKGGGKLEGKLTTSGTSLTLTMDGGTITRNVSANSTNSNTLTSKGNSSLSSVSLKGNANTVTINGNSNITGTLTVNATGKNTLNFNGSSRVGHIEHTGGELSFLVGGNSIVQNGITTSSSSKKIDIAIINNAQLNGNSTLDSTDSVQVAIRNGGKAGNLTFTSTDNQLTGRTQSGKNSSSIEKVTMNGGGNNKVYSESGAMMQIGELTMSGTNTINSETGGSGINLQVTGNASLTANNGGKNTINFAKGGVTGTLTTSGLTEFTANDSTQFGSIDHLTNNLTATFKDSSKVNNGITTTGTGTSIITFKDSSNLSGTSNLSSATNTLTLQDTSSITGNTSFSNNSTLIANNGTSINGQVITAGGTANYTFGSNGGGGATGATVTGGIDTQNGAGKTTANFNGSSTLQNGTSNFHSNIDITFASSSKANNEQFNVNGGTANITFQDNAEMQGGKITTNGGVANILFKDQAKMNNNGSINITNGTTKLEAKNSADLTGSITQSGGDFTANFNKNSTFTGNATQSGGTSNITFKDNAKWTGDFNQTGGGSKSNITFHGSANMKGNITTSDGETKITFDNRAWIKGDIKAGGTKNQVEFENSLLDGNLTLDGLMDIFGDSKGDFKDSTITGDVQGYDQVELNLKGTQVDGFVHQGASANNSGMKGTFEDSQISGGFAGTDSINNLKITHSDINNGVSQSGASLTMTATNTTIDGGFSGTNNSTNTVTMTNGSLSGGTNNIGKPNIGISQDTGSLHFKSMNTNISGGFLGNQSDNILQIANGSFNRGDITQIGGTLQGEIISLSNLNNFSGTNSINIIHLMDTKIETITQSGGGLTLVTDDAIGGSITGTNNSQNDITITGSNIAGKVSQNTGSMSLTLNNSNLNNSFEATGATANLYGTNTNITGSIALTNSQSKGVFEALNLKGEFKQNGGTSTMTFASTTFATTTTLESTTSASLIFTKSRIQDIQATRGISAINLSDSSMTSFDGNQGDHTITLVNSQSEDFNQNGGALALNLASKSKATNVTGKNFSTLSVTIDDSELTGDITNRGTTTIAMQKGVIGGDVKQTAGTMTFNAMDSKLTGTYTQTDGTTMTNFTNSSIGRGINLKTIANGTLSFSQNSKISNGFKVEDSNITFLLLSNSSLEGGYIQTKGVATGTINNSTLANKVELSNGLTNLSLYNSATINGDITANNHNTTILVDNSTINGNMTITGGSFDLTAQNGSIIQGNGGGGKSQVNVNNADFKLTLDTNSTFNGDITQTNNNQTIIVKQNSTLNGSITNTDVTSSISVNNATITGNIKQTGGSLALDLSNNGKINGNITLENSNTTLSGSGTGNSIGGDFTQTNGSLTGSMTGLTLQGSFSQTGGTSSVSFINSEFKNPTTITGATSSSLTFDNSTLKGYTTSGGADNTLKLINGTKMNGTLTLINGAQTTLTMDGSTLTGDNNTAITASDNSFLTFNTKNSTITGAVNINTGGLKGTADNTDINGNITLTTTNSDVSFTNTTKITGDLTATNGDNTIKFDNSSITGNVSQTGGTIKLDLSNGSGIGRDLTFSNATATLTGKGAGNFITGNFLSDNSTLGGDASGLTLTGTFTQNNGSSDIIFRNESNFNGAVSVTGATSSNLQFTNQSGINNTINITNGTNNAISLSDNSFINGAMTLQNTTATISASNNSSITGNLNTTGSNTTLSLSGSAFAGATTQTNGTLNVNATGSSTLKSNMTLKNGSTNIFLSDRSNLTGTITADNNPLTFSLADSSSFNSMENPQNITITNADFTLNASNNSVFGGNLTHTSTNGADHKANLSFSGNSFYSGTMDFKDITVNAKFNQSGIFSNSVKITGKSALFEFDGSTNGGVIERFEANGTDLTITTTNQSHITINDLNITGNTLNLTASNSSRLTANVTLENTTKATYTATTNGNLNVNTRINNQASTLTVNLDGGMMQGAITQDPNGANGFPNGEITLQSSGDNGGRWAVTDDSQVKELTLNNTQEALFSNAIFASAFNSPLSFVDFTLEFDDNGMTSRVGKEIIRKPEPINGQPIPEAGDGRTYVRQLQTNEIKGDNGLFRVYADLGTNLADNILASKASGNHLIQVQYRAQTFRDIGGDRIVVAKVTDPSTTVSFKGTQSEIGLTKYDTEIIKENAADGRGFEWIIGQATPSGMSYSSKIIASILQSQYRTFMVEIDSLDRRLGDLEFIKRDKGFWIRSYVGSNTKEATDFSTLATDNYYSIWSGFDYNSIGLTVHNYVGVFFNYTGINTESKDYVGKSSNIAFGIYNTFKANSGFYADILAKYIYTMSDFEISNYSLAKNSPKIDNHKFLLNAEIGYSFYYGEKRKSGYIEPQFQVTSGYIHKSDLSVVDVSGETIHASIGRNFPVSIRAGAFWGQVFGEKIKSHIKLGTSFVYDVDSGGILNFSDSSTELQFKQGSDFRWVLSARSDFTFGEFFKLYASFDTSFFGNYNTTYSANLGIRFIFGRSNNYVRHVPVVYSPYTPPVSIDDDKRTVPVVKRYTTKDIDQNYVGKPRKVESYIQGNVNPNVQQGSPTYTPSRKPHRDITSEVEF